MVISVHSRGGISQSSQRGLPALRLDDDDGVVGDVDTFIAEREWFLNLLPLALAPIRDESRSF